MELLGAHSFHMGMQNRSKLEDCTWGFLIHAFELKLWHFEAFPYVCIGKPYVCNVLRLRITGEAWARAHKRDDHYPIWSKLHYRCLLSLCGPTVHVTTLWPYSQALFTALQ